jgi:hypothetical protein
MGDVTESYFIRDILLVPADIGVANHLLPGYPFPFTPADSLACYHWMNNQERWNDLKKTYLYHNVFLYKHITKINFL